MNGGLGSWLMKFGGEEQKRRRETLSACWA